MFEIIIIIFSVAGCFFFAGIEMALVSIHKPRLRQLSTKRPLKTTYILDILNDPHTMLVTILIGNNIAIITGSLVAEHLMSDLYGTSGKWIAFLTMTFIYFSFSEIIPKTLFRIAPEYYALSLEPIIRLSFRIISPMEKIISVILKTILRKSEIYSKENKTLSKEEFLMMLKDREKEGIFSHEEKILVQKIIDLQTFGVNKLMTKWKNVQTVTPSDSIEKLKEIYREDDFLYIPVIEKGNVLGMTDLSDIIYPEKNIKYVRDIIKPVIHVEISSSITSVLSKLKKECADMAIVCDDKKPTGIVTLSSIIRFL